MKIDSAKAIIDWIHWRMISQKAKILEGLKCISKKSESNSAEKYFLGILSLLISIAALKNIIIELDFRYVDTGTMGAYVVLSAIAVIFCITMYTLAKIFNFTDISVQYAEIIPWTLLLFGISIVILDLIANMTLDKNILGIFEHNRTFIAVGNGDTWAQKGQWGDILSGHFSALAFLAVIFSIYTQNKSLKMQQGNEIFKTAMDTLNNIKIKGQIYEFKIGNKKINTVTEMIECLSDVVEVDENAITVYAEDLVEIENTIKACNILVKNQKQEFRDIVYGRIIKHKPYLRQISRLITTIRVYYYFQYKSEPSSFYIYETSNTGKELMDQASNIIEQITQEVENNNKKWEEIAAKYINSNSKKIRKIADSNFPKILK